MIPTARWRMIDANLNRAREGLRVMEDAARLGLGRADLSARLKRLRHEVSRVPALLPGGEVSLLASRDTAGDVGTAIKTDAESTRGGLRDAVAAACKRVTEALRVIEECAKIDSPAVAAAVERARYAAYDLERDLLLAMPTGRAKQWGLCVLITESLCKRPWQEVSRACIEGGADALQLREKSLDGGLLADRAKQLIDLARPRGVAVIVNDRVDVALAAGADGVHLGTGDLSIRDARAIAGDRLLIGASTHALDEARAAVGAGADYCGVGAMFATTTRPREVAGPGYLTSYLADETCGAVPHLAIGGISAGNISALRAAGCRGVAVSAAVCGAENPASVCRELIGKIERTS